MTRFARILKALEVPVGERQTLNFLKNPDLLPIRRENQTWGFWSNFAYWGVISFSVGTWISASSALDVGLSYPETIGTYIVGDALTIVFTLANSYPGSDWKIGYTLSQRFVFGVYGSTFGILIRVLLSIVNYGSNAWLGGLSINLILDSWSHHYLTLPNTLSSHVAMTTKQVIGFMIFHVLTCFCYLMKPYQSNHFLIISCVATFFAMLGMIIYLTKENHGVGSLFTSTAGTATGSKKAWAWVYMISYWFGSVSPGSVNQSDYSRFGTSTTAIWLGTICALLIPTTLIPVFGVIGASTSESLYGTQFWMPFDFFDHWLTTNYSAGARAGAFFCGVAFTLSQMAYTISNSGFASGMDLAGVFPKYINIKRGALITGALSFACLPWNFYNSSSIFLTVMSSFGVIVTPLISVMICDNFLIRKRQYSVSQAFIAHGEYYFNKGVNWRAMVAWVVGMTPGLPGIAWQVNNDYFHNEGIVNFYYGDSFFSFAISFFLYWGLCWAFPFKIEILHDAKDYYGAFTTEEALAKDMIPFDEVDDAERDAYMGDENLTYVRVSDNSSFESNEDDLEKKTQPVVCTTIETNGTLGKSTSSEGVSLNHVNSTSAESKKD
ncbi:thiamine transporter [Maudiozyma humilis]|uniref:Thiamine transporter n=1 Tax=Maudiozyma humilis TaxID=51915 RepID=A0AAV5RY89_MAUHU|nr:thiamine transporter [Kazachstania humilis]